MAVGKAVKSGRVRLNADGATLDPESAKKDWDDNTDLSKPLNRVTGQPKRRRSPGGQPGPALSDRDPVADSYFKSRAAREHFAARQAKLDFEAREGTLVLRSEVERDATTAARLARDLLLALPDRLGAQLAATHDERACRKLLSEEVRRICEEYIEALGVGGIE